MASVNRVRNLVGINRFGRQESSLLNSSYRRLCRVEPLERRQLLNVDWTFLVYMAADNNLEADAINDFLEMADTGSSDDVNIVVQMDRHPDYSTAYNNWTDTRRGLVEPNDAPGDTWGSSIGEADMGDPAVLQDFIEWGVSEYPASHYALVLWDHGNALSGGVCQDFLQYTPEPITDLLSLGEINGALAAAEENLLEHEPDPIYLHFDLMGFDACLMSFIETAYEIGDYADVMVGSQNTEPHGWNYEAVVGSLVNYSAQHPEESGMDPEALGTEIVTSFYEEIYNETQSAVRLPEIKSPDVALGDWLHTFAAEVRVSATDYELEDDDLDHIEERRQGSPLFSCDEYRDLGVFLECVAADGFITERIRTAAARAHAAYEEAVIATVYDDLGWTTYGGCPSGLSIYLPAYGDEDFAEFDYPAKAPTFTDDTCWDEFLTWWTGGEWNLANQRPTAADTLSFTIDEDTQLGGPADPVYLSGSDPESQPLTYWLDEAAEHGTVVIDYDSGEYIYIPDRDFYGTDSFTFFVRDDLLCSDSETVEITVNPVADGPSVINVEVGNAATWIGVATGADNRQLVPINILDADLGSGFNLVRITFDEPIYTDGGNPVVVNAVKNALTINKYPTGGWGAATNVSFNGNRTQVTWEFGGGPYKTGQMILQLSDEIISDDLLALDGEWTNPENFYDKEGNGMFPDGQGHGEQSGDETPGEDFVFKFTLPNTSPGDANRTGVVDADDAAIVAANWLDPGTWEDGDFNGDGMVNDIDATMMAVNWGRCVWQTVACESSFDVETGGSLSDYLFGPTQFQGEALTYSRVDAAANGSATVNADGSFTYTPSAGYNGVDSFTFRTFDGVDYSEQATVTVYVGDAPTVRNVVVMNSSTQQWAFIATAADGFDQLLPVPIYDGIDKIWVLINGDATVTLEDLKLNGEYADSFYMWDTAYGRSCEWTFSTEGPFKFGPMIIELSDAVNTGGLALDGEWVNPEYYGDDEGNSTFDGGLTSGDGEAGGDFVFNFSMLFGGDTDCDGDVDLVDLSNFSDGWYGPDGADPINPSPPAHWTTGDFDGDGDVDGDDFIILSMNWGLTVWPEQGEMCMGGGGSGGEWLFAAAEIEGGELSLAARLDLLFAEYGFEPSSTVSRPAVGSAEWDDFLDDVFSLLDQFSSANAELAADNFVTPHILGSGPIDKIFDQYELIEA